MTKKNGLMYTRFINRPIAYFLAKRLVYFSPNTVTIIGFAILLCACILFTFNEISPTQFVLGLLLSYIFDSADGEVARLTKKQSSVGEWLDHSLDSIRTVILIPSVVINQYNTSEVSVTFLIGALMLLIFLTAWFNFNILWSKIVHNSAQTENVSKIKYIIAQPIDTGFFYLIFLFAHTDGFGIILLSYSVYIFIVFFVLNITRTIRSVNNAP